MTDTTDIAALRERLNDWLNSWTGYADLQKIAEDAIDALEAERQRAERGEAAAGIIQQMYNELKTDDSAADLYNRLILTEETLIASNDLFSAAEAEIAALKGSLGSVADWEIDHSAGVPILMYKKCSVIESEQAHGLLNLIKQSELKGDQVPVALVDERQGSGGFCLTRHGRRLKLPHGAELFTAPQNPVSLPPDGIAKSLHDCDWAGVSIGNKAIILAAIHALRAQPQKQVVPPHLPGGLLKQWQFERDCEWKAAIEAAGGIVKDGDADEKPKQPFKVGDLIVQRHCHGEDYFIVRYAHDNGALDVTERDSGIKYGLSAWRCELVSRQSEDGE